MEGQRGPGRGPSRTGLAAISIFAGRDKPCAGLASCCTCKHGIYRHRCIYVRDVARLASRLRAGRGKDGSPFSFCLGWELPCAVWCLCRVVVPLSPGRSRRKKAMCSMWAASQSRSGQTGKMAGGLHLVRDGRRTTGGDGMAFWSSLPRYKSPRKVRRWNTPRQSPPTGLPAAKPVPSYTDVQGAATDQFRNPSIPTLVAHKLQPALQGLAAAGCWPMVAGWPHRCYCEGSMSLWPLPLITIIGSAWCNLQS